MKQGRNAYAKSWTGLLWCRIKITQLLKNSGICRAQTRSISPLDDIGRLKLISAFGSRIACVLPLADDYGNKIDNVNEVELRHLVYWSNHNLLTLTPDEKAVLYCLYDARNAISHLNLLSYDDIQKLFRTLENLI